MDESLRIAVVISTDKNYAPPRFVAHPNMLVFDK